MAGAVGHTYHSQYKIASILLSKKTNQTPKFYIVNYNHAYKPPTRRSWWTHRLPSYDYQTIPRPTTHPMAGADGHTNYSKAKIDPRLLPGPPPTQWQVLIDTQTTHKLRLIPDYSQAHPPPNGRCWWTHISLPIYPILILKEDQPDTKVLHSLLHFFSFKT